MTPHRHSLYVGKSPTNAISAKTVRPQAFGWIGVYWHRKPIMVKNGRAAVMRVAERVRPEQQW